MKPRTSLVAGLAATLALAGPSRAADPQPNAIEDQPPAQDRAPSVDITGRLRTTPNGLSLEIGGTLVELQISDGQVPGGESPGRRDDGAHDFRASFSVDGHATNLLLRVRTHPRTAGRRGQAASRRDTRSPRQQRTRALLASPSALEAPTRTAGPAGRCPGVASLHEGLHQVSPVAGRAAPERATD